MVGPQPPARPAWSGGAPRVLCFTLPIAGHMAPLLPVLAELAGGGAEVGVVTGAAGEEPVATTGAAPVGRYPAAFVDAMSRPSSNFLEVAAMLAAWTERRLLADAREALDRWTPDVVVVDSMAPWGRVAALERGLPVVTSTTSFLVDPRAGTSVVAAAEMLRHSVRGIRALRSIAGVRRRLLAAGGVDCGGPLGLLSNRGSDTVVYTTRELQPGAHRFGADVHFVGPTSVAGPGVRPPAGTPLRTLLDQAGPRSPLAYVALGTIYRDRPDFLRCAATALTDLGYRVVVAAGDAADSLEGTLPAGTVCVPYAPQLAILDHADLFVTHGGLNSVQEALWRSVPMVVYPQAADQPFVAARLAKLGAAAVLRGREPGTDAITRAAVAIRTPTAEAAAARLGADLRATGGAASAARIVSDRATALPAHRRLHRRRAPGR